ncbi:MAG TPA: hypothetical protein VMV75_06750 [Sulfuricella sp.]|nr:hypothetical protein [Sulfuricella sp.]
MEELSAFAFGLATSMAACLFMAFLMGLFKAEVRPLCLRRLSGSGRK